MTRWRTRTIRGKPYARELLLSCACGYDETLRLDLIVDADPDDPAAHHLTLGILNAQYPGWSWRGRAAAIYAVLTNRRHWFGDLLLDREDVVALADYLHAYLADSAPDTPEG